MYKLFDCSNKCWNKVLDEMPNKAQDIYYTSEYYKMHEINGDGAGLLFYYTDNKGNIGLYPFMINKINGYGLKHDYYDIETAYGYGGPITNCSDETFFREFEEAFINYCQSNYIVAEFIRFHPFLENEKIFNHKIQVIHNRTTVYLDLTKGIDKIWDENIKSKNRNLIRKAKKNGLYVEISEDYETFIRIYNRTMNKVNASDYYYFEDQYYESIRKNNNCVLLNIKRENKVIAAAIFMGFGDHFHYHLSGSLEEELKFSPNNLLLWEAINFAVNNGYKKMHFGGGLTDSIEDSLFKFKSSFSKSYTDFFIGKRIHDIELYNFLINKWEENNKKKANLFLQYRMK